MELTFNKIENKYVSEFAVTSDFNLHIERPKGGILDIYQRTSSEGEYAIIDGFDTDGKSILDIDFTSLVYPKRIKIISEKEPEYASVVTDGEIIPSAGGGARNIKYYDLSGLSVENKMDLINYAYAIKTQNDVEKYIYGTGYLCSIASGGGINEVLVDSCPAMAFDFDAVIVKTTDEEQSMEVVKGFIAELGLTEITKEEFYNLN